MSGPIFQSLERLVALELRYIWCYCSPSIFKSGHLKPIHDRTVTPKTSIKNTAVGVVIFSCVDTTCGGLTFGCIDIMYTVSMFDITCCGLNVQLMPTISPSLVRFSYHRMKILMTLCNEAFTKSSLNIDTHTYRFCILPKHEYFGFQFFSP